jgi:hypothetical protein
MLRTLRLSSSVVAQRVASACILRKQTPSQSQRYLHVVNRCEISPQHPVLKVSEELRDAIEKEKPVVALESTIYTHVM